MHRFWHKYQKSTASLLLSIIFSQWLLSAYAMKYTVHYNPVSFVRQLNTPVTGDVHLIKSHFSEKVPVQKKSSLSIASRKTATAKQKRYQGPGPGQPEMQSFQSLSSDKMVDLFTGDFSYSIPLLDVGGYPVNIHYRSGITMDQEASWVGLGWNINPGTIGRNMRGLPDDFNGDDEIIKTNYIRPNWTAGADMRLGMEMIGLDAIKLNLGITGSLFYNNYKGLGLSAGSSLNFTASQAAKGSLSAGLSLQTHSQSGVSISPSFDLTFKNKLADASGILSSGYSVSSSYSTRAGLQALSIGSKGVLRDKSAVKDNKSGPTISGDLVNISFAHQAYTPSTNIPFTSYQFSFNLKPGGEITVLHPYYSFGGFYSRQHIAAEDTNQKFPGFGYLHFQKANGVANAMLDYNREKELIYHATPPTPHIAIPSYTYDIYNITAEGNGGMFRPYRGDIGFVRDADNRSKSLDGSVSLDLGTGNLVHAGFDVRFNSAVTQNSEWKEANLMAKQIPFKESDADFEAVYFKNPAEKTINLQNYYDKLGDTDPVMAVMNGFDDPVLSPYLQRYKNLLPVGSKIKIDASQTLKQHRDKRSQVISYLTADDASLFGLDKKILIYPVNSFFAGKCGEDNNIQQEPRVTSLRKKHHLSEITVLNPDGKRYIYGLPIYNTVQKDVSFSVNKENANSATGQVAYTPGVDNSTNNKQGKDNFYSSEQIPGYAHSFLLTGIVSADYVDKTGDGISDDDMGDAVKFNYSRIYGGDHLFRWRTPFAENKAAYNEALKTDKSDDKGSYIYGEKEIWYLNSLESKSMIATFTLSDPFKNEMREDAYGVKSENGGPDTLQPLRYLKQIDLYSKADFIKNKENARPIKTVHFFYNYELCRGNPSSSEGNGKLTLKKIWFTYNNNEKETKNPYVFLYHPKNIPADNNQPLTEDHAPKEAFNPGYNTQGFDRWGNYKNAADNPDGLSNANYPYTLQEGNDKFSTDKTNTNVAAWTLSDILLPSAGRMNIEYESDDYAFVQNKRAMQMCTLAGMGESQNLSDKKDELYKGFNKDYLYAFIKIPSPIVATTATEQKKEILRKYLEGVKKLYFRLRVDMPGDVYGDGEEHVSTYAQYEDYGLTTDKSIIWIKLKGTDILKGGDGNASPLAKTALQTLRLNLPSKAYPNSDLNGEFDALAVVKASYAMLINIGELFLKFPVQARIRGWAKKFNTGQSFVRLNNPVYKKYGDGLRVKRITIYDNWATMTNDAEKEATYGQEYDYTTTKDVNGLKTTISSGVASYEPNIGNDENPFRLPIEYDEQVAPLAPVNNMYSEHPLGEMFFPSPSVGYSKVRVHTIHHKDVKSATGFTETEFYTTYDFPTIVEQTPLETRKFNSESLLNILNLYSKKALAFSQGFKVETNDMNGKIKGTASYPENDPYNALAYTKYYYKVDDENAENKHLSNTVAAVSSTNGNINMQAQIGKDIEIMTDMRQQEFASQGANIEFNADGFMIAIVPVTIVMPWLMPHYEMNRYRSAAITKVVQRYGILDKVTAYEKGSLVTTENLLYDGETGDVLLTKTINEFNDPVYQFNYPAHWAYSGMGPAYKNIGAVFNNISFKDGKIISAPGYSNIESYFESGDEIKISGGTEKTGEVNGVNICTGFGVCDMPIYMPSVAKKIWAIDASKLQPNPKLSGVYFIDEDGKYFTGNNNNLQIIRSGKRNMPAVNIGTVTSLQNPMQQVAGKWQLVLDNSTKVVNTAAVAYTDFWKVEDARYQPQSVTIKKNATKRITLNPTRSFSIYYNQKLRGSGCTFTGTEYIAYTNTPYFESLHRKRRPRNACEYISQEKSWLQFDLSSIPADATIINSNLALYPHYGLHEESDNRGFDWHHDTRDHSESQPHKLLDPNADRLPSDAYLYRVTSKSLFNGLDFNTLTDNSIKAQNIFNNTSIDENTKATVMGTKKQNSFLINVKSMVQSMIKEPDMDAYIQIGPQASSSVTSEPIRVCFWSVNSYNQLWDADPCAKYGPIANNSIQNNSTVQSPSARTTDTATPSLSTPCTSCSNVTDGYKSDSKINNLCPTAPQLTIEYISCEPGFSLVQECDSFYCIKTVATDSCLSRIADTATNPYRWGILGNWRTDQAYTYYSNRTESNTTGDGKTNIREYGTVANFDPFWKFSDDGIRATNDTVRWVWNSQSTLFNRKGFELENKDPLGRRNSVQYGYNESIPMAVTQNARYTEQAYDGFEDYHYQNDNCSLPCNIQLHTDKVQLKPYITSEESHSGVFSLGVPLGKHPKITVELEDTLNTSMTPSLYFNLDTSNRNTVTRVNNGSGLKATVYKNYDYWNDNYGLDLFNNSGFRIPMQPPTVHTGVNVNYDLNDASRRQKLGLARNSTFYKVVWEGYLTLRKTPSITDTEGEYRFSVAADNSFKLWIDDKLVLNAFPNDPVYFNNIRKPELYSEPVKLLHGKAYKIRVEHTNGEGQGLALLNWIKPNSSQPVIIPVSNFHETLSIAESAIRKNTIKCINKEGVRVTPNIVYKEFSPSAGNRYLISAWVKEQADCKCDQYENASIQVAFIGAQQNEIAARVLLKPSGNIIEGWQRIEEIVTVPADAVKIEIYFDAAAKNGNAGIIYFDDWRFLPYHANMKSFVYNAINLRLMAELDENNYASFFEYDDDGTLIRVKKETERGIKTIKETRSALRKE